MEGKAGYHLRLNQSCLWEALVYNMLLIEISVSPCKVAEAYCGPLGELKQSHVY